MHKTVVINAVGLTPSLLGEHTPRLRAFASAGKVVSIVPPIPAVTCTSQATFLTGKLPREHGIVGNGWYFRDECEIKFWRQSNRLVQGEKVWETAKKIDSSFTCANLFWWFAMYSSADYTVTPRPIYTADGRKIPDVWTNPPGLRRSLQDELGQFPLFQFWGPNTDIAATKWIADAAIHVDRAFDPTLSLIYLPHLDYDFQRFGPDSPQAIRALGELDGVAATLIDHYRSRNARVIILSEYGLLPVTRPIHLNRVLRAAGLLAVRDELGRELLDAGASIAFAVADHQVAHVYASDGIQLAAIKKLLENVPGVARVLDADNKRELHLDHPRAGELVCLAEPDAWFTYYYWIDDAGAPDFARTVDIRRKPGYDPVELYFDPRIRSRRLKTAWKLLLSTLRFRTLFDVIPLDATLVKGSHGLAPSSPQVGPVLIAGPEVPVAVTEQPIAATAVSSVILQSLGI